MELNLKLVIKTTIENGGFSSNATKRYMVALEGFERIIPVQNLSEQVLMDYIGSINLNNSESLGTWLDNGLVYFDKSVSIENLDEALELAKMNNQLAIYDTVEGISIYL